MLGFFSEFIKIPSLLWIANIPLKNAVSLSHVLKVLCWLIAYLKGGFDL
jgi:hypothetical protein